MERSKVVCTREVYEFVFLHTTLTFYDNVFCIYSCNRSCFFRKNKTSRIWRCKFFDTCSNKWSNRKKTRCSLFLHVTSHECSVCVVVFKERHHRCCDRKRLIRSNVDKVDLVASDKAGLSFHTSFDKFFRNHSVFFYRSRRVRNVVLFFFKSVQILNLISHLSFYNFHVWSFDNTEVVYARIYRQVKNKTDVRTFRSVNRTNASVVRCVHVAHFKTCALTCESAGSKC